MKEVIKKKRITPTKKRSQLVYQKKIDNIRKWYERLLLLREKKPVVINPNSKQPILRKELKDVSYYIEQIKKVVS